MPSGEPRPGSSIRGMSRLRSASYLLRRVRQTPALFTNFGSVFLEEVPRQLTANGVPEQFASAFAQGGTGSLNELGGVDIVVNNAGAARAHLGGISSIPDEEWQIFHQCVLVD